jgi:phenylacetate-coenzyme A ligase PaaK-like adenylate-forming protein
MVFGPIVDYAEALNALLEVQATCAVGLPAQLLALSRWGESGFAAKPLRLRSVLLCSDYVPRAVVGSLTEAWGCTVYSHYGMTEMGLGGGVECSALDGYHMRDADLLFEIIDPATGTPKKDGEYGEVVFSTLTRRGMPFLRYRTGDRSRFLPELCLCGSILKRMERISGRIDEAVPLSDGSSLSITQLDEIVLRDSRVLAYAAEMCAEDGCDCLVVAVQSGRFTADCEQIGAALRCCPAIGSLVKVGRLKLEIREGDAGYFSTGTAKRFIVDRRKRDA